MSNITIELTAEQLAIFETIGIQMRATPAEVILSAACSYVDIDRDDEAAEYSSNLFCYLVRKQTPTQPKLWKWIPAGEAAHAP